MSKPSSPKPQTRNPEPFAFVVECDDQFWRKLGKCVLLPSFLVGSEDDGFYDGPQMRNRSMTRNGMKGGREGNGQERVI